MFLLILLAYIVLSVLDSWMPKPIAAGMGFILVMLPAYRIARVKQTYSFRKWVLLTIMCAITAAILGWTVSFVLNAWGVIA